MIIGKTNLENEVYVIAEIGNNHEGDIELASKLIKLAAEAGVNAVKFQAITPIELVNPNEKDRIKQLTKFCFNFEQFSYLSEVANKHNVDFICTPFSLKWIDPLSNICTALKIASGDNNFHDLIVEVSKKSLPIIISTGLINLQEVTSIVNVVKSSRPDFDIKKSLALLHCVSSYPASEEALNLKAIETMKTFGCEVGYSDHSIGNLAALISVSLGASIIEKHFTIDKNYSDFRDHQLSSDFNDMKELVLNVKRVKNSIGKGKKMPGSEELESLSSVRRSICATRDLSEGHKIENEDLIMLRPGNGLPPYQKNILIGKKLTNFKNFGETITLDDIDGD